MKTLYQIILSALAGACAALIVMKFMETIPEPQNQTLSQTASQPQDTSSDKKNQEPILPLSVQNVPASDFSVAINKAMPAVVCVSIQKIVGISNRNFFRPEYHYYSIPAGTGSGFIVHPEGYIVTNYHVISGVGNGSVLVTDRNGQEYKAKIVGADATTDLAVLKINHPQGSPFPTLSFADSNAIQIGQWTIAIGAPFNLEYSVTSGIVSSLRRSSVGVNRYENYVQTDASINPGNSGGPLLNINGDVIGVNDVILTPNEGSIGISLAISTEIAKPVVEKLISDGYIDRPWLGITAYLPTQFRRADGDISSQENKGVTIRDIFRNSPAAKAGIRHGDVILSYNDKDISNSRELRNCVLDTQPGVKVKMKLKRGSSTYSIEIQLESAPRNWFTIDTPSDNTITI